MLIYLLKKCTNNNETIDASPPLNISNVNIEKMIQDKLEAVFANVKSSGISVIWTDITSNTKNTSLQRNSIKQIRPSEIMSMLCPSQITCGHVLTYRS